MCFLAQIDIFTASENSNIKISNQKTKDQEQLPFASYDKMNLVMVTVLLCLQANGLLAEGKTHLNTSLRISSKKYNILNS